MRLRSGALTEFRRVPLLHALISGSMKRPRKRWRFQSVFDVITAPTEPQSDVAYAKLVSRCALYKLVAPATVKHFSCLAGMLSGHDSSEYAYTRLETVSGSIVFTIPASDTMVAMI